MKIKVSQIVVSENPVRTSQDEEKMSELVNSIREKVHNTRAEYINNHGGQSQYLQVRLLALPEPSNQ